MKQSTTTQVRSLMRATVMLLLALSLVFGAQPAWATVEEDIQSSQTAEETQTAVEQGENAAEDDQNTDDTSEALEDGQNTDETSADDETSNEAGETSEEGTEEDSSVESSASVMTYSDLTDLMSASTDSSSFVAFSGADRNETSALQALEGWESSDYIILVGSNSWPDALSASGLAGALDCPILLTNTSELKDSTKEALEKLNVQYVIVLGDSNSVSDAVTSSIEAMGISWERVGGSNRYETNLEIYKYGEAKGLWKTDYVVITSGSSFADVLSYSPVAYVQNAPIFLTDSSGALSSGQKEALKSAIKSSSQAIILGGTDRVSASTVTYVTNITSTTPKCIAGEDRYETSAQIAEWAVSKGWLTWNNMALAAGGKPYDALGGGALQGKTGAVLLLVRDSSSNSALDAAEAAYKSGTTISTVRFFGDKNSVPNTVRMDVADRFGFAYSDIEGLKVYIDAGHGYNNNNNGLLDNGASGSNYLEYNLTSDLANRVAKILEETYGIETYVNDDGGYYRLRHAEAIELGCDLLVSIHFNANGGTGTESYIHSTNASWKSADLQSKVHSALVAALGLTDRGMKDEKFAVLSGSLPAVLLEICFIDKASDMSTYMSKIDNVAAAIAAGIAS